MIEYGEAYRFLQSLGFTFKYDNIASCCFSDTHVLWYGKEFGVMYNNFIVFHKDGKAHFFYYDDFSPEKEFKDFVLDFVTGGKHKFIEQKKRELEQDFVL